MDGKKKHEKILKPADRDRKKNPRKAVLLNINERPKG